MKRLKCAECKKRFEFTRKNKYCSEKCSKSHYKGSRKSLLDIANIYGVSLKMMKRWIVPIISQLGDRMGNTFNRKQSRAILEYLDSSNYEDLFEEG
jgi:transposase-like protein